MTKKLYVIHTQTGYEENVKANLEKKRKQNTSGKWSVPVGVLVQIVLEMTFPVQAVLGMVTFDGATTVL